MPQNEALSDAWKAELGDDWQRIHEDYLHTLGNLTLTGYNSELSESSFTTKRDMKGGFAQNPLRLNEGLGEYEKWGEAAIQERAQQLATRGLEIWTAPELVSVQIRVRTHPNDIIPELLALALLPTISPLEDGNDELL